MNHTLITFLGKGFKGAGGYRTATYRFDDGNTYTTAYFGLALLKQLAATGAPVDHLVILGTAASIWDALLLEEMGDGELWTELSTQVEAGTVDDAILERVAGDVTTGLIAAGLTRRVSPRVIPYGRDNREQIAVLQKTADLVEQGDRVSMDISHGFRTLPMLGLMSALFLKSIKQVHIMGVYYGALEMTGAATTPVVRLDGLLRVADWLTAISAFRASGDYGLFAPLIDDQDDVATSLRQAGFFEKTLNIGQARKQLKNAACHFSALAKCDPVFELFSEELYSFTEWAGANLFAQRQLAAAHNALATGDYLRSAALTVEAYVSHHLPQGADPADYSAREHAKTFLAHSPAYQELKDLRNALAHGTRANRNTYNQQTTLASRQALEERLAQLLEQIRTHIS
jgi:CRISPR-associated Csx2 family protein